MAGRRPRCRGNVDGRRRGPWQEMSAARKTAKENYAAEGELQIADLNERRGKAPDPSYVVTRVVERGNSVSYLLRRLARDTAASHASPPQSAPRGFGAFSAVR